MKSNDSPVSSINRDGFIIDFYKDKTITIDAKRMHRHGIASLSRLLNNAFHILSFKKVEDIKDIK